MRRKVYYNLRVTVSKCVCNNLEAHLLQPDQHKTVCHFSYFVKCTSYQKMFKVAILYTCSVPTMCTISYF
jgi:hypothetical protein